MTQSEIDKREAGYQQYAREEIIHINYLSGDISADEAKRLIAESNQQHERDVREADNLDDEIEVCEYCEYDEACAFVGQPLPHV